MHKIALFIDAFITNETKYNIFTNNVHKFAQANWDIFVISNKIFSFDRFSQIKYFEYDCEDRILKDPNKYILPSTTYVWNDFYMHDGKYMFEAHFPSNGYTNWTILYNLKKICKILKEKGYTHLIRCEYDIDFKNYDLMSTIFKNFGKTEKSLIGMGVRGDNKTHPGLVTNFFLIGIDYLDRIISDLNTEQDYINYLHNIYGTNNSPVFESLFYHLTKDDFEILDQDETFSYINNPGLCGSDGGNYRHQSIRKDLMCALINNDKEIFIWNTSKTDSLILEISTDGVSRIQKFYPTEFCIVPRTFTKFIEIRSNTMSSNDIVRFDADKTYNYASFYKVNS